MNNDMFHSFDLAEICSMPRADPYLFKNFKIFSEHYDFICDRTAIVSTIFYEKIVWTENPSKTKGIFGLPTVCS